MLLSVYMCGLLLQGAAQDRAALWRGNDRNGRCQYTFSVPSPVEASCPRTTDPEVEDLKARLSMLEALVSHLMSGNSSQRVRATAQGELQEALNQVEGERNLLQGVKERLEQELERLQRRMEEMRREADRLKSRPCPLQTPIVPPSPSVQGSSLIRPAGGKSPITYQIHLFTYSTLATCAAVEMFSYIS